MRFASLVKMGGELIVASQADYEDYKGFLRCPECGEPVFLRKSHTRGNREIGDAFVHHRAVPEVSVCELRVGNYTNADVAASRTKAKGQRLAKLKISLWKFLKTGLTVNLKSWSTYVKEAKDYEFLGQVANYGKEVIEGNKDFILDSTLPRAAEVLRTRDERLAISPQMQLNIEQFLNQRARDWQLHCQIAREALELFIESPSMGEIRHRLCCCLCNPKTLQNMPELLDLDTATPEWKQKFVAYMTLQVVFVFLLVDWVGIWSDG